MTDKQYLSLEEALSVFGGEPGIEVTDPELSLRRLLDSQQTPSGQLFVLNLVTNLVGPNPDLDEVIKVGKEMGLLGKK
jgi:hypothetical protein